ncbi:hypothetical protein Rxycam_00288 [Rubrobacter xylanophilus DSM 9941]|uniref:hypothetical protein n=1 Tax=Rubrobacter xylanophilus TaxID=49319 RepID=UPI001C6433F2|nr:hypothetical protein [Rubrobacter xylanophilus]QYJ14492.1 hypothetical protein Rxycam_00288 [Rubrobacter xylanophilus DSM 9941]
MPGEGGRESSERGRPIRLEPGAPRPATILQVAEELEARGAEIVELFKELRSGAGEAVYPIHARREGREIFVEVETGVWDEQVRRVVLERAAVLRRSEYAAAELWVLSAHPVPSEVRFLTGSSPGALLQLDLVGGDPGRPEEFAELFRQAAGRQWGVDLDYSLDSLPLTEELVRAALDGGEGDPAPALEPLVNGLGCFLGEVIRRSAPSPGSWIHDPDERRPLVECGDYLLDTVGKARAFLQEGPEDSISFYARYALGRIRDQA